MLSNFSLDVDAMWGKSQFWFDSDTAALILRYGIGVYAVTSEIH